MFTPLYGIWLAALLTMLHTGEAYQRFVAMPDHNRTTLVDLEAKPDTALLKFIRRNGDINRYLLYTRQNPRSSQELVLDDDNSIKSSNFNPNATTAVLIHGWQSQPSFGLGPIVTKALLDKEDVNVIVVDWRKISALDYVTAVSAVPSVGEHVGLFLEYLSDVTGMPYSSVHLIGHSLGAHVSANAGRKLGGRVARITGLDPAGPGWYLNPGRIRPSDAVYVEAIHTNGGGLGIENSVADVDFYANGGSLQPGCVNPVCHHGRSYELFAASVTNPNHLIGKKCGNLVLMEFNLCNGSQLPLGNNDLRKTGSGIYRLNTGWKHPY